MFAKIQRIHFVGIGGIGMSGIAEIMLNLGYKVSGSDLKRSSVTDHLKALGATIFEGHAEQNVAGADVVVTSSAISPTNPEVLEAHKLHVPVIQRAEMLAELMRLKYGIAIAGMHGKTTTTSMVAALLAAGGLDPTVVVGGRVDTMGSNARLGRSQYLVAEADESDRSFLKLSPILAVVTNIDREHMDCYRNMQDVKRTFLDFMDRVPFYGMIVACNDDPILRRLMPKIRRRMLSYGTRKGSDFQITLKHSGPCRGGPPGAPTPENNRSTRPLNIFAVKFRDRDLGEFQLHVPGVHNVLNATAAIAVGIGLDISIEKIHEALESFRGVDRRFQLRGKVGGVAVIDDYGHHPTEIRATLAAARQCGYRKIHVIFQPHRYTRTRDLMDEFTTAFSDADSLTVLDIYPASEQPIEGITGEALASRIAERWNTEASGNSASPNGGDQSMVAPPFSRSLREGGSAVRYVSSFEEAVSATTAEACEGDMILTLGAGSVSQLGPIVVERLAAVPHDVKRALTPSV
jgi:UDP-N-acetylmuramate--alanine ligase